jgi:hypothetical protein
MDDRLVSLIRTVEHVDTRVDDALAALQCLAEAMPELADNPYLRVARSRLADCLLKIKTTEPELVRKLRNADPEPL